MKEPDFINNGKIKLNYKLGVFTVISTSNPQVVRLFPQAVCSCADETTDVPVATTKRGISTDGA